MRKRPGFWMRMDTDDTLAAHLARDLDGSFEALVLTGTAAINATGNALANTLTGNAGANVLDGMAGADLMAGGLGNDTYVVDESGDVVSEAAGAGTDTVRSTVNFALGADVVVALGVVDA